MGPRDLAQWKRPGTQIKALSFKGGQDCCPWHWWNAPGRGDNRWLFLLAHVRDGQLKDHKLHSFRGCADRHHVYDWTVIEYKDIWAWELKNPIVYSTPKPYFHPRGAIVWIDLTKQRDGKSLVKREPEQRIRRVVTNNKKRPSTSVS